jgi:CubicO group peptidase (beta-lactamase class C family)
VPKLSLQHSLKSHLDTAVSTAIQDRSLVGATALIEKKGKILLSESYGLADRDSGTPMRENAIFRIASMTKPITSALTLMLIEDGVLDLDTPIEKWLPELAKPRVRPSDTNALKSYARSITVRDLLAHRSGISYPFSAPEPWAGELRKATGALDIVPDHSPDEWLYRLAQLPLLYQPGERWHYGYSSDVLGVLLSRAAEASLGELMQNRIFEPLGMEDTGFYCSESKLNRLTTAYVRSPESGELDVFDPGFGGRWSVPPVFESGGAGLVSTMADYLRFAKLLLRDAKGVRPIISPASIKLMRENLFLEYDHAQSFLGMEGYWQHKGFGLGLSVVTNAKEISHRSTNGEFNWPGAFGTHWFAAPQDDLIGIFFIQEYWSTLPLSAQFQNIAYEFSDAAQ